jgi:PAS domain S-box-containing protein
MEMSILRRKYTNARQADSLTSVLDIALQITGSHRGSIMFLDRDEVLRIKAYRGMDQRRARTTSYPLGVDIPGRVAQSGQAYLDFGNRVSVPIRVNSQVIGVMNVENFSPEAIGSEDCLDLLCQLADLAGFIEESSGVAGRLEQRLAGLFNVFQIKDSVRCREKGRFYDWVVRLVSSVAEFDSCWIYLAEGSYLSWKIRVGNPIRDKSVPLFLECSEQVVRTGQPILNSDPAYLAIPLIFNGDTVGSLNLLHKTPNQYCEEDLKTITVIVSLAELFHRSNSSYYQYRNYAEKIINSISNGVINFAPSGRVVVFNRGAEKILKISHRDVLGRRLDELLDKYDFSGFKQLFDQVKETGENKNNLELRVTSGQSEEIILSVNTSILEEEGEKLGITMVFEDLTERKRLEENLRYADRLASAGQLAAGIAHEIRNPLTAVKGFTQLHQADGEHDENQRELFAIMLREIQTIEKIIDELLTFSQNDPLDNGNCSLTGILEEALFLLGGQLVLNDVSIQRDYPGMDLLVYGDRFQLKRAFVNIILNGIQASPRGQVTISFRPLDCHRIRITIEDDGAGIEREDLVKVFDPFFTTKDHCTGLGLPVAAQIIKSHGGEIELVSVPGQGTRFDIILLEVFETQE